MNEKKKGNGKSNHTHHKVKEQLTAEHDGRFFRISIDRSMLPPFYDLFEEYEQDGRLLNNRLFASSQLRKIEDYIKDNVL